MLYDTYQPSKVAGTSAGGDGVIIMAVVALEDRSEALISILGALQGSTNGPMPGTTFPSGVGATLRRPASRRGSLTYNRRQS